MKKIIIATDNWYPQISGVVKSVEEIKKQLEKNNFEVTIIHAGLFFSVPMIFYPEITLSLFPTRKIKKMIAKIDPDYIHVVTEGPIALATRAFCLKHRLKFTTAHHTNFQAYTEHYSPIPLPFLVNVAYTYLRWFHNAGNATMVSTQSLKAELESHGFTDVVVSPLGVNTDFFKRAPIMHTPYPKPVFTYVGRLAKEKSIEEFLECSLPGTKLIIGAGPLKKELEKKYRDDAVFVGWKQGRDLVNLLSISDVLVFPSRTETFGLVVIEALACGVPVAAHDVMGPKDIITQGVDGFLGEDLQKAALKALALPREKCREKAMKFSLDEVGNAFIKNLVSVA